MNFSKPRDIISLSIVVFAVVASIFYYSGDGNSSMTNTAQAEPVAYMTGGVCCYMGYDGVTYCDDTLASYAACLALTGVNGTPIWEPGETCATYTCDIFGACYIEEDECNDGFCVEAVTEIGCNYIGTSMGREYFFNEYLFCDPDIESQLIAAREGACCVTTYRSNGTIKNAVCIDADTEAECHARGPLFGSETGEGGEVIQLVTLAEWQECGSVCSEITDCDDTANTSCTSLPLSNWTEPLGPFETLISVELCDACCFPGVGETCVVGVSPSQCEAYGGIMTQVTRAYIKKEISDPSYPIVITTFWYETEGCDCARLGTCCLFDANGDLIYSDIVSQFECQNWEAYYQAAHYYYDPDVFDTDKCSELGSCSDCYENTCYLATELECLTYSSSGTNPILRTWVDDVNCDDLSPAANGICINAFDECVEVSKICCEEAVYGGRWFEGDDCLTWDDP